jgi:LEA14-like dessication related protein
MIFRLQSVVATMLLFTLLSGCSLFIHDPRIAVKGTNLVGLDSSGIDMEFYLGITNPNAFDLSLLGYTYDLHVMTLPLSTGGMQETIIFPAGKETDMRLPVHLKFSDLLEIIKRQPDLNKLPYRMNARLHLKHPLGEMVIPVEKDDALNVPERYRPGAAIERLRDVLRGIR